MQRLARKARERVSGLLGLAGVLAVAGLAARAVGCGGAEFQEAPAEDGGLARDGAATPDSTAGDGAVTPDGGSLDGGNEGEDAPSGSDDGGDAGMHPGDSGGVGSPDSGDAGPPPFCPSTDSTVIFCSDFDNASPPQFNWTSSPVTAYGTLGVDTADFVSPPNGFAAANKIVTTGNATIASLGKSLSNGSEHLDYSFELFVKRYDTLNNPVLPFAQLTIGTSSSTSPPLSIQLLLKGGNLEFSQIFTGSDGGEQSPTVPLGPLATGVWVELELLLDRGASGWTAMVLQDGVQKIDAQIAATPGDSSFEVDLGIIEVLAPTTANALTFDNVLVRAY